MKRMLWQGLLILTLLGLAAAHDKPSGGHYDLSLDGASLVPGDRRVFGVVSDAPESRLEPVGRGERLRAGATTDVWVHGGYAYIGTYNTPCGTGKVGEAGVQIFDVRNPERVTHVGAFPSVKGSRVNDVKVAALGGGDILVHSNEPCGGGPGGFEIYNVDDPQKPVHLAHVQTDSVNATLRASGEGLDRGVHNLFLFSRDGRDYAAAQVSTLFGNFQIFDITDPEEVALVSWFGPERLAWPEVDWTSENDPDLIGAAEAYLRSGYGQLANRILHDHYVAADGKTAYLAHWDAGLITLDLTDLANPKVVSVALAAESEDGEVNSHSVWPSEGGRVVVEGEEDFDPYGAVFRITEGPDAGVYPAMEGAFTAPVVRQAGERLTGSTVYVGNGCTKSPPPQATAEDQLALVQRGRCAFMEKGRNVAAAGYAGMIVFNDVRSGESLLQMGGEERLGLPGLFVGHETGLAIAGVKRTQDLTLGASGHAVQIGVEPSGWSGLRIWDFADPYQPVLASTFNTVCSAHPDDESCDPRGIYSSHNVMVEGDKAYVSWYAEGVLVIDISDPYHPVEVARYHMVGPEFEAQNGGIQEVWGIYKVPGEPWIYASDRNGGLYILRETAGGLGDAGGY